MKDWNTFEKQFPLLAQSLRHAVLAGRLSHSHLVATANPDFRLAFPVLLAMLAACTDRKEDGAPCGVCETCRLLKNGLYPDLFTLAPISKSRQITVGQDAADPDTLRSFEAAFHLGSVTASGWKIGIIQDADTMNVEAQNAFLKTLEEPPEKCLFVLATGRPGALLPTIRSRCQLISLTDNICVYDMKLFGKLSDILLEYTLHGRNDFAVSEKCVSEILDVLSSLAGVAEEVVQKKWEDRLKEAENLESAGVKLLEKRIAGEVSCEYRRLREHFISYIHSWFAQLVILSANPDREMLPNPEIMQVWFDREEKPKVRERDIFHLLTESEELLRAFRTNVNEELALRSFFLNASFR